MSLINSPTVNSVRDLGGFLDDLAHTGSTVPYSNEYVNSLGLNSTTDTGVNGVLGVSTSKMYPKTTASTDPYAKYGGKAAYDNLVSGFDTQKQNIFGTSMDAARQGAGQLRSSVLDFVNSARSGQRQIDNSAIENELARREGTRGVLDMVGRGVRSAGVMLNNKNASDSSAGEAVGRAYGDIGRRSLSSVGNQYEMGNRQVGMQQDDLNQQVGTFRDRKFGESKEQLVSGIVTQARNSLAQLDAAMLEADLPTRIQIEQEKEAVKAQVLAELSSVDQLLQQETASVRPMDADARRAEAVRLSQAGQAPANSFDFTSEAPAQFQNTGPFPTNLPLFTLGNRRREA